MRSRWSSKHAKLQIEQIMNITYANVQKEIYSQFDRLEQYFFSSQISTKQKHIEAKCLQMNGEF